VRVFSRRGNDWTDRVQPDLCSILYTKETTGSYVTTATIQYVRSGAMPHRPRSARKRPNKIKAIF
jgi:hypothetical protein